VSANLTSQTHSVRLY